MTQRRSTTAWTFTRWTSAGEAPMHPSYEDRPGAADRCFALVDDAEYDAHVAAWELALQDADAGSFDVLMLNT